MILIFDLDDTLYEEINFVKGGLRAVSIFLSPKLNEKAELIYKDLFEILEKNGRGQIFDIFLKNKNKISKNLIKQCIRKYRYHQTNIDLKKSALDFLKGYKSKPLYLVTDGNKNVQQHKIHSLNVENYFKKIYITHRYGIKNAKPSLYCFRKIKKQEKCSWSDLVYIGDNPHKDFVSLKKVNAKTIRVLTGNYSQEIVSKKYEADYIIKSLNELKTLISKIEKNES